MAGKSSLSVYFLSPDTRSSDFSGDLKESKADHELSKELYKKLPGWLREKKILPNNTKLYDGGLDDVEKGFQEYRDGKISAYKIVYKVHEVNM